MDHWGDPWADNTADEQKLPGKLEVTSPPPIAHNAAPVLLNGFLDDAGWGNEDASFGDWATSSGIGDDAATAADTRAIDSTPLTNKGGIDDGPRWDVEERGDVHVTEPEAWGKQDEEIQNGTDIVTSDTSDTSTTSQDTAHPPIASSNLLHPEDDSSAQPSTSPSETSRYEAPVESPRTSIEEERLAEKTQQTEQRLDEHGTQPATRIGEDGAAESQDSDSESEDDEFGTFTEDVPGTNASSKDEAAHDSVVDLPKAEEQPTVRTASPVEPTHTTVADVAPTDTYHPDSALLDELFPPSQDGKDIEDAPNDPIYSTSGRKAWYRLTRKQTMREFNGGGDGEADNYIRVTWAGSQVRSEVNKTVGRWAREDRLSGTGPGARASFYWDTPAPVEPKIPSGHMRTKTTVPTPRPAASVSNRQSLPPPSTNTPAAFNWSSPAPALDAWKLNSPVTSSPLTQSFITADNVETKELRASSLDVACNAEQTGKQTFAGTETPDVAHVISQPVTLQSTTSSDPWTNFSTPTTDTASQEQPASGSIDDDDEWGEMISSPTVFTPTETYDNSLSAFSSAPKTPPDQVQSAEKMHIVRLRSTISPTSALFERKSFVPLHAEEGPIGPQILKARQKVNVPAPKTPTNDVLQSLGETVQRNDAQETPPVELNNPSPPKASTTPEPTSTKVDDDNDFSAFTSSTIDQEPAPTKPYTPPPTTTPSDPTLDSWANADFSIFESAPPPTTTTTTTPPKPKHDRTSIFGTPPPRSSSAASSAKTFTRSSPPRNITPPSVQPLTGATNAAQRRKNEEDMVVQGIIAGLPDLRYMLR